MQLHWAWAALGALALGTALAWWMTQHEDAGSRPPGLPRAEARAEAGRHAHADPDTLYRWIDAHGVVNVSNSPPPAGTRYRTLHIDPNQNVVPMGSSVDASPAGAQAH